ncbi:LEM domain-containing protein 1 [Dromiciops gliroides]|uniref:LEM domain-containing protein 1 n=1 Tax=Dromiciops gliroides TaxID=33562 RepID=UPI001CC5E262|nr:LEM domain-containing protein 1 [Dromiciops gliroides]
MTQEEGQVPISMVDIQSLTNSELQEQLIKHGYKPGPIIPSTRQVYEDKLLEMLTDSSLSTELKVKEKTEEPYQDLENEEDEENLDDMALEKNTKISPRKNKKSKMEHSRIDKNTPKMNYELEQFADPITLDNKLSTYYSLDGDIDIYYPDPSSHTGIRITIRRPLKSKSEDSEEETMVEDERPVEKKVGVISIAFMIAVLLIFAFIIFVYFTMEKKVITG